MWLLEKENILVPYQAGFRKGRSAIDNLVALEYLIQETFRKREHAVMVLFDIKGAYDMTWRYGVIQSLHRYGLRGNLPKIIQSFLNNRSFCVRVGNTFSDPKNLENGIPQGSTLSCSLFAIAINEICQCIDDSISTFLYVDDLAIVLSGRTIGEISRRIQPAINQIVQNGESIGYLFSTEKTQCIHFCRLRTPHYDPVLYINDYNIPCKNSVKFLGAIFDSKLS